MTWEELQEKAKELGYSVGDFTFGDIIINFYKTGIIDVEGCTLARDRTYEQMYAIMEALK